jgi:4-alpha-glucanotransferase
MQDQTEQTLLARLADRTGIVADYYDIAGVLHVTSSDTQRAILTAMGFAVDSAASLTQALQEWDEAPWQRPCDPVRILHDDEIGTPLSYYLTLEDGKEEFITVEWQIRDEHRGARGTCRTGTLRGGSSFSRRSTACAY